MRNKDLRCKAPAGRMFSFCQRVHSLENDSVLARASKRWLLVSLDKRWAVLGDRFGWSVPSGHQDTFELATSGEKKTKSGAEKVIQFWPSAAVLDGLFQVQKHGHGRMAPG